MRAKACERNDPIVQSNIISVANSVEVEVVLKWVYFFLVMRS